MTTSALSKAIKQNASEIKKVMNNINSALKEISLNPMTQKNNINIVKPERFCKYPKCKGISIKSGGNYCLAHNDTYSSSPPIPMKTPRRCPCGRVIPNKNKLSNK